MVAHWPRELIDLPGGERVSVSFAPVPGEPGSAAGTGVVRDPLLLVHGMAGAATNWTQFMAELAGDFDCDALDLPGSGWSPPPAVMAGYSTRALAGTVIKVIEHRGRGPVHLIGNSMGGLISVRVAAARPDLVRTLTLISPALPDRSIRRSAVQFPLLGLPIVGEWLLGRADRYPAEARVRGVMGVCFHDPDAVDPESVRRAVAEMERRDGLGYANACLVGAARAITAEYLRPGWAAGNAWRLARRVRCPVLAMYGAADQLVHPRMAGRAAREFRDCRVMVLPCTGHVAQMEHPARVAREFRELASRELAFRELARTAVAMRGAQAAAQADVRVAGRGMPAGSAGFEPVTET